MEHNIEKQGVRVYTGNVARKLLRKGYTIVDVKPHKNNHELTMFIFENKNNIRHAIKVITEEIKNEKKL